MVTFEEKTEIEFVNVIGSQGIAIAKLKKGNLGNFVLCELKIDQGIGKESLKQICKKLKELNNANV